MLILGAGCVRHSASRMIVHSPAETAILDVPFVPQAQKNDCGPAAMASVLAFHGQDIPLEEITRRVFTPALQRTLLPDMENFAASLGFSVRSGRGDPAFLREQINGGLPVILMLDTGRWAFSRGHYVVVFGHRPDGFLIHAGNDPNVFIRDRHLLQQWDRMNRLYLLLE